MTGRETGVTNATGSGYRGRFAPSPTGPLHFGSLVAATASYLQSVVNQGEWLLRIEDLDPPREEPGAAGRLVATLEAHGFRWHGPVRWQSRNLREYHRVAEQLLAAGQAFRCTCTRDAVRRAGARGLTGPVYPGTCRLLDLGADSGTPSALRLRTDSAVVAFTDALQGSIRCNVAETIGDFVIRRKDGLIAYNLAVVVDDARQGITEIVRGCDLLDLTPAQIALQRALGVATPRYMHVPVAVNDRGQKLSKQHGAMPVDDDRPAANLLAALRFLGQDPPDALVNETIGTIWAWAAANWRPAQRAAKRQMRAIEYL